MIKTYKFTSVQDSKAISDALQAQGINCEVDAFYNGTVIVRTGPDFRHTYMTNLGVVIPNPIEISGPQLALIDTTVAGLPAFKAQVS